MPGRNSTRGAPRGPAAARRNRHADRDGDVAMDVTAGIKGRGGRIGKSSATTNGRRDLTVGRSRGGLLNPANQRAILKHAGAGDVAMKESRTPVSRGLQELKVTNWNKSKASTNPDGGVSSLIGWLEKKASHRLSSRVRTVKIKKVCR